MFEEQDNWSSSASSSRSSSPYFVNEEPSKLTADKKKKEDQASQQHIHASLLPSAAPQPSKTVVSGFHKPGDKAFSLVAVPPEHLLQRESENLEKASKAKKGNDHQNKKQKPYSGLDAQGIGSSVWASKECRCLRCEMLRTSSLWSLGSASKNSNNMKNSTRAPMLLVLMDADNFGFHAFSRKPTSNTLFQYVSQEGNSVFVWAFYGANFRKDFHQDLEQFIQNSDKQNNNNNNNKFPKHLNTWGYLRSKKSIQATKCEGSAQAADLVIEAVASLLVDELKEENLRCSLITGDLGLRRAVGKIWQEVDDDKNKNNNNKKMTSYYIPELTRGESDPDVVWRSILNGFSSSGGSARRQSQASQGQRRGRDQ